MRTDAIIDTQHEDHNRQVEALELSAWAAGPERAIGYVTIPNIDGRTTDRATVDRWLHVSDLRVTVSTWIGTPIAHGTVTGMYRNNFGARIVSIRVRGTNGRTYVGRYGYDGGSFIRLRAARKVR